jgi:hypothetical protein
MSRLVSVTEDYGTYIPFNRPVKSLGDIMISLAVSPKEQKLELCIWRSIAVQCLKVVPEPLPLSLLVVRIKLGVGIVGPINQTETCL